MPSEREPRPILEVEWVDAARTTGWTTHQIALTVQPVRARSVGYLLDRSPTRWLLASALVDGGEQLGPLEQIPATLIVSARCLANCENLPEARTPEPSDIRVNLVAVNLSTQGDLQR